MQKRKPSNLTSVTDFYEKLTSRNHHFVKPETQKKLSEIKVLIGGCGSIGGAAIDGLARIGVQHFHIADLDSYDITNMNRQKISLNDIGVNKAKYHKDRILQINPNANVTSHENGLTYENTKEIVKWADIIIDGVDITTDDGIKMKTNLHVVAKKSQTPVVCGLDAGYRGCGFGFDYRKSNVKAFDGRLEKVLMAQHPIKKFLAMFPLSSIPDHTLPLIEDMLTGSPHPVSQLGMAADLFSATSAAVLVRFAETDYVVPNWSIELESVALSPIEVIKNRVGAISKRRRIKKLLKKIK